MISKKLKKTNVLLENINDAVSYAKKYTDNKTPSKQIVKMIFSKCNTVK
jgi:hypothetical protein